MSEITITEGSTRLIVPEVHSSGGPGKRTEDVFFNEQMAFNRDVSVMLLRAIGGNMTVADAMSASGARAVRIANEVPSTQVTANDRDPKAATLIERNISLNSLDNCVSSNRDLGSLLSEGVYDYVDIDPFGSPMPFLHSAIRGCRRNGILAITATDTAPLAGANPAKCIRRYGSRPYKGRMCHDTGLRILMASVARELAKFDRGMEPILSFYADHYFRTYVRVTEGANNADLALSKLVHLDMKFKNNRPTDLERRITDDKNALGPFWGGPLHDRSVLERMSPDGMEEHRRCESMLDLWRNELDVPFPYDVSELSSFMKISPPRMDDLIETLKERGNASRSHMAPTLVLTDLSSEEVMDAFRKASLNR